MITISVLGGQLEGESHGSLIISHHLHAGFATTGSGRAPSTAASRIARRRRQVRSITSAETFLQWNWRKKATGI